MNSLLTGKIEMIFYAIHRRRDISTDHKQAVRLFNGFLEGLPELSIDLYARTAVIYNFNAPPQAMSPLIEVLQTRLVASFPWLRSILLKERYSPIEERKSGIILWGDSPDTMILENCVLYCVDLKAFQDASFFLDTRQLRNWIKENAAGKRVLNTFAYTGSLGITALAGDARMVVQLDRSSKALEVARTSSLLNSFRSERSEYLVGDYFKLTSSMRKNGVLFDLVILDPPFYSTSARGTVDMTRQSQRMINKIRPLVESGGFLVVVNNALFLSGREFMAELEALCDEGYMEIEALIPVPEDFTGYADTRILELPADPAPFNHATKIAVLRVTRKSEKGGD